MVEKLKDNTEQQILQAAKNIFIKKGLDGARMQEIADEAQINKAMLHYYFRSKERLFTAVFKSVFQELFPRIPSVILSEKTLEEKISWIVWEYLALLEKNPFLPAFVMHEINRNPQRFYEIFHELNFDPSTVMIELQKKHNFPFDTKHFLANLLGMTIFPFIAKPLLSKLLFQSDDDYQAFLTERHKIITDTLIKSLQP